MKGGSAVTSIAIIVLAIGAASYAYFVDRGRVSDLDRADRRRDVFPSFRVESVRRVELAHGAERLVLERALDAGAAWVMAEPRRDAVDAATVDALLRELEMAARLRDVQDGDAAGLDAPRVRGSVMVGPLEYRFVLGADAVAPDGAAYMRVEGEGTFVVGRSLKVQLLRGASAYRERALVPYGASDVARVEVRARSGSGRLVLERTGTSFRIGGGAGLRASGEAVEHLFGALAEARAKSFLDDAGALPAASETTTTVELTPRDPALPHVRLVVGGACPVDRNTPADGTREDVVVVRTEPSPVSVCVGDALAEALVVDPDAQADRSPFSARADEIEELRIERLDMAGSERSRVDLARRGGGWHERAPLDRDLGGENADSANALAAAVAGARALDVRHAEPGERFLARARVTIMRTGAAAGEIVETSTPDATGVVLARRLDDGAVLRLAGATAVRFEPHPIALDGRALWPEPFDPGAVMVIDDSCAPAAEHLELRDGVWRTRAFEVDGRSAAELAGSFARARAEAWVSETAAAAFGFEREGSCAVMLGLPPATDGASPRRIGIIFGAAGEGGFFARTMDEPGVFLAPPALRDVASRPAVDRGRFRIDPATLTRLVLTRSGARIVLSRPPEGDRLERLDRDDAGPDDRLESALAALSADGAVHTGPPAREEGIDHPTLEIDAIRRGEGGPPLETRIAIGAIGAPDRSGKGEAYFARVAGVDATFVVRKAFVDAILDAL